MDDSQQSVHSEDSDLTEEGSVWWGGLYTVTPFSKYLAMVVFVALPFVGFWFGMEYVRSMQSLEVSDGTEQGLNPTQIKHQGTSDIIVDVTLSSLSARRAKVDILWNHTVPEEVELLKRNPTAEFRGPIIAIAEPLDLIESFTIRNNSDEPVELHSIFNEQLDHIEVLPRIDSNDRATPLMLLGDSLRKNDGSMVRCHERNVIETLRAILPSILNPLELGNDCVFEQPEVIAPGEVLTLQPVPYLVSYGKTGEIVADPFSGLTKTIFEIKNSATGNKQWLIPKAFEKYDDVLQDNTFNVGGYIVANIDNVHALNNIFDLRKGNGSAVSIALGETTKGHPLMSYDIPLEPFDVHSATSSEKIVGLQSFLYLNGFLAKESITGTIELETIEALKEFQRSASVYPTGLYDTATAHTAHSGELVNLIRLYENYGDENVYLGLDTEEPYFRYWGMGTNYVERNNDSSDASLITKFRMKSNSYGVYFNMINGSTKVATYNWFWIINNTAEIQDCGIFGQNGIPLWEFSIPVNDVVSVSTDSSDIKELTTRHLRCGKKEMIIEVSPESEQPE